MSDTIPIHGPDAVQIIEKYNFPLGGRNFFVAEYWKHSDAYRWQFTAVTQDGFSWVDTIALGLSRIGRFGGLTGAFNYSVGQHSVLMEQYILGHGGNPAARLLALLHDAPECLGAGDQNTYLKRKIGQAIKRYENDLVEYLLHELEIDPSDADWDQVEAVDALFGAAEARVLGMWNGEDWKIGSDHPVYRWLNDHSVSTFGRDSFYSWTSAFRRAMEDYHRETSSASHRPPANSGG